MPANKPMQIRLRRSDFKRAAEVSAAHTVPMSVADTLRHCLIRQRVRETSGPASPRAYSLAVREAHADREHFRQWMRSNDHPEAQDLAASINLGRESSKRWCMRATAEDTAMADAIARGNGLNGRADAIRFALFIEHHLQENHA